MRKNILLNLTVNNTSPWAGDLSAAIDEAYALSKELNIGCTLNYLNQYKCKITPDMTEQEIKELREQKVVIGM